MKSVGETMAIGRNFKMSLQKAFRSLEIGVDGLDLKAEAKVDASRLDDYLASLPRPAAAGPEREIDEETSQALESLGYVN